MGDTISEQQVVQFLRDHPDFLEQHFPLADRPKNLAPNMPPNLIDMTGRLAANAREEARHLARANHFMRDAAAANMMYWQALHYVTLGFLACTDLSSFGQMIETELPVIFDIAEAKLVMPENTAFKDARKFGFLTLPAAPIEQILEGQQIYLGPEKLLGKNGGKNGGEISDKNLANTSLFSKPMASMAAIALPDQLPVPISGSMLILGGKDKHSFTPEQGQILLTNLAEIVGVCLLARYETAQTALPPPKNKS